MAQERTAYISVTATKGQRQEIRRAARRAGLTVSTFCLHAALERARGAERNGAIVTQQAQPKSLREHSASETASTNEASRNVVGPAGPSSRDKDCHEA